METCQDVFAGHLVKLWPGSMRKGKREVAVAVDVEVRASTELTIRVASIFVWLFDDFFLSAPVEDGRRSEC